MEQRTEIYNKFVSSINDETIDILSQSPEWVANRLRKYNFCMIEMSCVFGEIESRLRHIPYHYYIQPEHHRTNLNQFLINSECCAIAALNGITYYTKDDVFKINNLSFNREDNIDSFHNRSLMEDTNERLYSVTLTPCTEKRGQQYKITLQRSDLETEQAFSQQTPI